MENDNQINHCFISYNFFFVQIANFKNNSEIRIYLTILTILKYNNQ